MGKQYNVQAGAFRAFYAGNKVETMDFDAAIADVSYMRVYKSDGEPTTTTVCNVTLDNGYTVQGVSSCVDPANYDEDKGNEYAYKAALQQLWPIFGTELKVQVTAQEWARGRIELIQSDDTRWMAWRFAEKLSESELALAKDTAVRVLENAFNL